MSSAPPEVEAMERRRLYLRRSRTRTWGGCINRVRDKVFRKRVGMRDEGRRGAIITPTGLWDDEGREALWWQRPHKLGEGICICEERARTILHGRKKVG